VTLLILMPTLHRGQHSSLKTHQLSRRVLKSKDWFILVGVIEEVDSKFKKTASQEVANSGAFPANSGKAGEKMVVNNEK